MARIAEIEYVQNIRRMTPITKEDIARQRYDLGTKIKHDGKLCTVVADYFYFVNVKVDTPLGSYVMSLNKVDLVNKRNIA